MGKQKELKYTYVFDEFGRIVNATNMTIEDKVGHKYYIEGKREDTGELGKEEVYLVIGKVYRNHFKRFPTVQPKDGENRPEQIRVAVSKQSKETVLHKLAKQLFQENKITWLNLPNSTISFDSGAKVIIPRNTGFIISKVSIEHREYLLDSNGQPDNSNYVVFDILAEDAQRNKKLAIEILVNHKCDTEKLDKLRDLNIDTVEIDISHLLDNKSFDDGDLEDKIIEAITSGKYTVWVNDTTRNKYEELIHGIVEIDGPFNASRYISGGNWYIYKDMISAKIPNCPKILDWDPNTAYGKEKYIEEAQCLCCPRYIGQKINQHNSRVLICNQTIYDNTELFRQLFKDMI